MLSLQRLLAIQTSLKYSLKERVVSASALKTWRNVRSLGELSLSIVY